MTNAHYVICRLLYGTNYYSSAYAGTQTCVDMSNSFTADNLTCGSQSIHFFWEIIFIISKVYYYLFLNKNLAYYTSLTECTIGGGTTYCDSTYKH